MTSKKLFELAKADLNVFEFASRDDSRPLLTGIYVREKDDRYELIATDSYRLVIHAPKQIVSAKFEPFILPADVLRRVKQYVGTISSANPKTIELWTDHIAIPELGVSVSFKPLDGNYPDVDKLVKGINHTKAPSTKLNPVYVAKTMQFFASISTYEAVEIVTNGVLDPVEFKSNQSYAVVMPLKS